MKGELGWWERFLKTESEEDDCAGNSHGCCKDSTLCAYHRRHDFVLKKRKRVLVYLMEIEFVNEQKSETSVLLFQQQHNILKIIL